MLTAILNKTPLLAKLWQNIKISSQCSGWQATVGPMLAHLWQNLPAMPAPAQLWSSVGKICQPYDQQLMSAQQHNAIWVIRLIISDHIASISINLSYMHCSLYKIELCICENYLLKSDFISVLKLASLSSVCRCKL